MGTAITIPVIDAFVRLQHDAGRFGLVNRSVVRLPNGAPESDTDHTVSLLWFAAAFADKFFPGQMDHGLICQFAAIHDAAEVEAGDTPTLDIGEAGLLAKRARESAAVCTLMERYEGTLDWFPRMIALYEQQVIREARIVRALDKIVVKLCSLSAGCADLIEHGMTAARLRECYIKQRADIAAYAGEFPAVMAFYDAVTQRVLFMMEEHESAVTMAAGSP